MKYHWIVIVSAVCLVGGMSTGCGSHEQHAGKDESRLSELLGSWKVTDIVGPGEIRDSLLYKQGDCEIWVREVLPVNSMLSIEQGKVSVGIYIFDRNGLRKAIPANVAGAPFGPIVYPVGDGRAVIVTYSFTDRSGAIPARYDADVHLMSANSVELLGRWTIDALKDNGPTAVVETVNPFVDLNGRIHLIRMEWTIGQKVTVDAAELTVQQDGQ